VIDFDALVNATVNATFGDIAKTGRPVSYLPQGAGAAAFNLDGVFDEAWREVSFNTSRHSMSLPVSTTKPAFGCRLSDFPSNLKPRQGDTLTRYTPLLQENGSPLTDESGNPLYAETQYTIADPRPDGVSGWYLLILK